MEEQNVHPFLRWAGGKRWLTPRIHNLIDGRSFNNYFEPFIGGGAIFFSMPVFSRMILSDLNEELISTYKQVRDSPNQVIRYLQSYENTESFYYSIRDQIMEDPVQKAARFIYLNMTSFNGIYRVNLKGKYNVPFGYKDAYNVDVENILNASSKLKHVDLLSGDFESYSSQIQQDDLVILDPPYTVSHNNNGFVKYNQKIFSIEDQLRLRSFIDEIDRKGGFYVLTNAAHESIKDIFVTDHQTMELVSRASMVGGKNAKRGKTQELLFTNII